MEEEYKNAFEDYEISNFGNVRRKLKNGTYKAIGGSIMNMGYRYFQLQRNNKRENYLFHTLVAEAFLGERPEKKVIDHIDRNKLNNNVSNLRYITQLENCRNQHRYITGLEEETNLVKRHAIICKLYREKNRTELLEKKKAYYRKNIDNWKDENGNWK